MKSKQWCNDSGDDRGKSVKLKGMMREEQKEKERNWIQL